MGTLGRHTFQHTAGGAGKAGSSPFAEGGFRGAVAAKRPVSAAKSPNSTGKMLLSTAFAPPPGPGERTLLPGCIPAPKNDSCAICGLALTVAYGNKLNKETTPNHTRNTSPSRAQSESIFITRQPARRPRQWPVLKSKSSTPRQRSRKSKESRRVVH